MQTLLGKLTQTPCQVAILWGAGCDEAATAIFVSQLRQAGVRVKLVGIGGPRISGQYGVKLVPDLPINRAAALARKVCCVVIPCCEETLLHFLYDPYLVEFLQMAQQQGAQVVVAEVVEDERISRLCGAAIDYPTDEALFGFVQRLAEGVAGG